MSLKNKLKEYFIFTPGQIGSIGFSLISVGIIYIFLIGIELGTLWITIGLAVIAAALNYKSERLTKKIAKSVFYDSLGLMNNGRLTLRRKFYQIETKRIVTPNYRKGQDEKVDLHDYALYYFYSIWLCLTYLNRTLIFEKYLLEEDKNKLIHEIDCFFMDFGEGRRDFGIKIIDKNYLDQLDQIYKKISSIDIFNNDVDRVCRLRNNLKYLHGKSKFLMVFTKS